MDYLLFVFKSGGFKKYTIKEYGRKYLHSLFNKLDVRGATYSIYNLKADRLDRGYVNAMGDIRTLDLWKR